GGELGNFKLRVCVSRLRTHCYATPEHAGENVIVTQTRVRIPLSFLMMKWRRLPHRPPGPSSREGPEVHCIRAARSSRLETRGWMTLMLGLAVALAGCSAVQPSTSMPVPSFPKGAANVEPDKDQQKDGTPLSWGPARPRPDRSGPHVVEIALKH